MNKPVTASKVHWALFAVIAGGSAVRLWTIAERSFWSDEAFSYSLAREATWLEMLQRTAGDTHPPLFYGALRLWSYFSGTSVVGLRLFSVLWAMATLVGCYLFCKDALHDRQSEAIDEQSNGRWIGVATAALIGACSIHIKWSQEVRMYSMGSALVFFSTWMLVRAMRASSHSMKWWGAYVFTCILFAHTHNFALFSIAGQVVWCLCSLLRPGIRGRLLRAGSSFLTIGIAYLPWALILTNQTAQAKTSYWTPPLNAWTIPECLGQLVVPTNTYDTDPVNSIAATVTLVVMLGLLAWRGRSSSWLLISMILTPMACAAVISLTSVQVFISRYFLFAYMFVLCAVPCLAMRFLPKAYRNALIGLLVANSLVVHGFYWSSLETSNRPGIRGVTEHLAANWKRGDEVVVTDLRVYFSVRYYLRETLSPSEMPRLFVPNGSRPEPYYFGGSAVAREWMIDEVGLQNPDVNRIWIVDVDSSSAQWLLNDSWQPISSLDASFLEAYYFLRTASVSAFERKKPPPQRSPD